MEIAVLDLGSTTFHLQHFRFDAGERLETTLDTKRTPLLGAQVFVDGFVDRRSWLESLEAVHELVSAARACRPDRLLVVATSAIRSASNGPQLVREMERRHDISVRVLDPLDEARFAYLGHTTSPMVGRRRALVIDLGGGSVEMAVGADGRCLESLSLPIGAVRMRARSRASKLGADELRAVQRHVREQLEPALPSLLASCAEVTTFGSGSARAVRKLLLRDGPRPGKTGPLSASELRAGLEQSVGLSAAELVELGVDAARAQSVLVAAAVMAHLLDALGVTEAHVSDKGLRDGVALDAYRRILARRRETPFLSDSEGHRSGTVI